MSNLGKVTVAIELNGKGYYVALPQEKLHILIKLAEGLSEGGKLPVVPMQEGATFIDIPIQRE